MKDDASRLAARFSLSEPVTVTAEKIAEFCAAVGENNPLFTNPEAAREGPYGGIIAPPAYADSLRRPEPGPGQAPQMPRGGLMAGIDMEFGAPIRPGDAISVTTEVKETYEKTGRSGTMTFTVIRSTLTNQKGELVAYVDHRMMRRR